MIFLVNLLLLTPYFIKCILFYLTIMPFILILWCILILSLSSPVNLFKHLSKMRATQQSRGINRPVLTEKVKNIIYNKKNGTEVYVPRFHAIEKGPKGAPLMIFIHGFPESFLSWRNQMDRFSSSYRCVAISLPGYGQSARKGGLTQYQVASVVLEVVGAIKHLCPNGKAVVVGHDWGGMIAYGVATLYPEVVEKLIVMSCPHPLLYFHNMTATQFMKSFYFIMFQMPYLPEIFFSLNQYEVVHEAAKSCALEEDDALVMQWCFSHPDTMTPALNYYRNIFTMDYQTFNSFITKKLPMSHLLLWGSDDAFVMAALSKNLAEKVAPKGHVVILKGANHFIQQERPDEVNEHIATFLEHCK